MWVSRRLDVEIQINVSTSSDQSHVWHQQIWSGQLLFEAAQKDTKNDKTKGEWLKDTMHSAQHIHDETLWVTDNTWNGESICFFGKKLVLPLTMASIWVTAFCFSEETWRHKMEDSPVVIEGWSHTCWSILERGARAKLAAQMANVYNGIESCPA